ncbi:Mannan endo-1,6-alpha-mannosidase [Venustampulla echinocandica]|uniref:Mannan endo-1,6-alpha-mannosidase n=1 Tax=Venustampulla echinocandica TaxID=2656787 RepID=A0A370U1C1_9HELO|nr:Mannan endo-1,6-alpha-mannosidase [Venustampulla echinocandica]RDL41568.1 Mannan endo-1,6-alpha-mannosidase [Venustampulla echinocandica]
MARLTRLAAIAALTSSVYGLDLKADSSDSIKSVASTIAQQMVSYYHGNQRGKTVGLLDSPPYYFWESGAMFDTLIQYWHLTGDNQYNDIVSQGLQAQIGPNENYMPTNQSASIGNDDQAFWALAAMSAAEAKLPESQGNPTWISLADAVFNDQVARWDNSSCNGGLRWQIFALNTGYSYKNSITNGMFFQLATRLARYTGNSTYSDWATKTFDWTTAAGFIDAKWNVFDGAQASTNCSEMDHVQFSYVAGTFVTGAAHMYNINRSNKWKSALDGLLRQTLSVFFPDGIAYEVPCEKRATCTTDMHAMKGLLAHWLVDTIQMAPYTSDAILPKLKSTASAAAATCNEGACGFEWSTGDKGGNKTDVGYEISALSYVQGLLVGEAVGPVTASSGGTNATGTSTGSGPGTSGTTTTSGTGTPSATANAGSIVGAAIYTTGPVVALLGSVAWLIL